MVICAVIARAAIYNWSFNFAEVRAYRINWDDLESMESLWHPPSDSVDTPATVDDLNPTRLPVDGVRLTDKQVARLRNAVCGYRSSHTQASCFWPHHAFLFLDEEGKIVASFSVCFRCSTYYGKPDEAFARIWNLKALRALVEDDLGMPIANPAWYR